VLKASKNYGLPGAVNPGRKKQRRIIRMGELYNQLASGGPELLDLNGKQRQLFEEQLQGGEQFAADVVYVLRYVRDLIKRRAYAFCAETPYEKGGSLFLIDFGDYLAMIKRDRKPFTEDEFRTLLVWAGHGPAIVHPKWVEIFREAIIEANFTSQPSFTFLRRLIEAAE